MADKVESAGGNRFTLRDVPGTTVAVAALAVLGAAAVVSAPFAVWYWRKRKRADALASSAPGPEPDASAMSTPEESTEARGPSSGW